MIRARTLALVTVVACRAPDHHVARGAPIAEQVAVPSDRALAVEIDDALAKKHREVADRALDANDPGELLEHSTILQITLDHGRTTLADLLRLGDDLFAYQVRPENGLGNALAGHAGIAAGSRAAPNLRRVEAGAFGGPDAIGCADCHSVGGDDGAGTLTQNSYFRGDGDRTSTADARNAPAVLGLGPVQALALEMTAELGVQRADAIAEAARTHADVRAALHSKGVAFGAVVAHVDGSLDTTQVAGVSADLVVRPFGWKGHQATLRGMVRESFRVHLGMVSMVEQQAVRDGRVPAADYGDGPWYDVDNDGASIEIEDGAVTAMVAYLAQLEVPIERTPDDAALRAQATRGRDVFAALGCASCHVPELALRDPIVVTRPEQDDHPGGLAISIDVARDGMAPKIPARGGGYGVPLFSDLRRHDLGAALAAPIDQPLGDHAAGAPIAAREWLTRPLWGLADTAPYLHDGRALTVDDAIRAHDGEAAAARDAYAAAPAADRGALVVFLLSLGRTSRVVAP